MTAAHPNSIALLIDADNAPAGKIEFILSELAAHGVVNIRRAYGNWTKSDLGGWIKVLHENSIQPMQSFDLFEAIDLFEVKREKHNTHTVISVRIAKVGGKKVKPKAVAKEYFDDFDDDNIPF